MIGKLLGRLAFRGWRDGRRADRRWAKGRDERLWRSEADGLGRGRPGDGIDRILHDEGLCQRRECRWCHLGL